MTHVDVQLEIQSESRSRFSESRVGKIIRAGMLCGSLLLASCSGSEGANPDDRNRESHEPVTPVLHVNHVSNIKSMLLSIPTCELYSEEPISNSAQDLDTFYSSSEDSRLRESMSAKLQGLGIGAEILVQDFRCSITDEQNAYQDIGYIEGSEEIVFIGLRYDCLSDNLQTSFNNIVSYASEIDDRPVVYAGSCLIDDDTTTIHLVD